MATLLTHRLLRAYEERLRDAGPAIVEILRPGLPEDEIDATGGQYSFLITK